MACKQSTFCFENIQTWKPTEWERTQPDRKGMMMQPHIKLMGRTFKLRSWLVLWLLVVWLMASGSHADTCSELSKGQTVYVPVYSHIYTGDREQPIYLSVTLSIRNTDPNHAISIFRVDYYDSNGQLIKNYLKTPITLTPLATTRYVIKESDKVGGSGANFIVGWKADRQVVSPLIETVMISTRYTLGISFTSRGWVIGPASP